MIRRVLRLWQKDLAQHSFVLAGLFALLALIASVQWLVARDDPLVTSVFAGTIRSLLLFVPVAGLVLGHYLVVREYHGRSQLFLEALPLRRWEVVLAKLSFGYAVLSTLVVIAILGAAIVTDHTKPGLLLVVALRALVYAGALWALFFTFGLLGRLRLPMYVLLVIGVSILHGATAFDVERFGPIALVDSTFAYEGARIPTRHLLETLALSVVLVGIAVVLSLIDDGSLAEALAKRASQREKSAFFVFLMIAALVAFGVDANRERQPFEFTGSSVRKSTDANVAVLFGWPELEPRALSVVIQMTRLSQRMTRDLGMNYQPPFRIAHRSSLGAREIREQSLPDADGILLEANLGAEDLRLDDLLRRAAHATFIWVTEARASFETHHWFLDGFSVWFVEEQLPGQREQLWLRALAAARRLPISAETVERWEHVSEVLGVSVADGLAYTAVQTLEKHHGRRVVLQLAANQLAQARSAGIPGWLRASNTPLAAQLEALTGRSFADFVESWKRDLSEKARQPPLVAQLRRVVDLAATVRIQRGPTGAAFEYTFSGSPPDETRRCALLYTAIPPYDLYVDESTLERQPLIWPSGSGRLSGIHRTRYGEGQRVFVALECESPELGSPIRLEAVRATVR